MTPYLLDTNHAGRFLRRDLAPVVPLQRAAASELSVGMPTVGELEYMVANSDRTHDNRHRLQAFLDRVQILPFDRAAAREFGLIRTSCRRRGRQIPGIDAQIAAIARVHGLTLLTADAHFDHVDALRTENWLV